MFVSQASRSYTRGGQQKQKGYFLVAGLPDKREPAWYQRQWEIAAPIKERLRRAGEAEWKWHYELPEELKEYKESLYHPPFKLIRCFVRFVRMEQCGHFMMGSCKNPAMTLSGTYGSDGLPVTMSRYVWERCMPLPEELCDLWATGGGHNTSGAEGPRIYRWANDNLKALKRAGK